MFDAVAQGLAAASNTRSLLIVLDDLHWADESTVRLLQFLARDTRPRRLAVVGTYRDTDLDPSHPLAVGLSELVRDGLHLTLGGLGPRDVATLVRSVQPLDDKVAEADAAETAVRLHRQSGGNPFFLWELLQLERSDGARGGTPAGVRAVVSRRLQKLSGPARDALAAASVLGADVDAAIVCRLLDRRPQETLTAVAEAEAVGLVARTRDGAFRFVHDLVREVLYDELDVTTRANFHHRAVAALEERYGGARPAETAHHVFAAALSEPDERCVDYAVRAAERAWEVHAYEEAGHWYIRALQALPTGDPRESDLLLRNGEAQLAAGDLPAARAAYEQAARMARADHDAGLLARAALGLGAGLGGFEVQLLDPLQIDLLAESLRALGSEPSSMRAWVLARLSVALSVVADESRRRSLSAEAVEVARAAGDPQALGYALAAHCDAIPGPDWCDERALAAADIVGIGRETDDRQLELLGLRLQIVAQLETGDLGSADVTLERFALIADRLGQPLYRWYVPLWRGMRALMRGEFATAARHGAEAEQLGQRAASGNAVVLTFTQWWVRQRCEGHQAVAGSAMADLLGSASAEPRVTAGPRAVIAALVGDLEGARELLVEWLASGLADRTRDSEWLPESAQLAQVAVAAGVREVAERLYADLRPYADRFCVEGIGAAFTGSVAWYLALLARFLGHPTEADAYARQARAAHTRVGLTGDPRLWAVGLRRRRRSPRPGQASSGRARPGPCRGAGRASGCGTARDYETWRFSCPARNTRFIASNSSGAAMSAPAPARCWTRKPGARTSSGSGTCSPTSTKRGRWPTGAGPNGPRTNSTRSSSSSPRPSDSPAGPAPRGRRRSGPGRL